MLNSWVEHFFLCYIFCPLLYFFALWLFARATFLVIVCDCIVIIGLIWVSACLDVITGIWENDLFIIFVVIGDEFVFVF